MTERDSADAELAARFAESLVRAAREDGPSRAAYERTLGVLTAGAVVGGALATGSVAAMAPKGSALWAWLLAAAKWSSAVLLVPLLAGAMIHFVQRARPTEFPSVAVSPPTGFSAKHRSGSAAREAVVPLPVDVSALPSSTSAPRIATGDRSSKTSSGTDELSAKSDDLAAEVSLLNQARRELRAGSAADALDTLERYRATFRAGTLGHEASVLHVEALLLDGRRAEATAIAEHLLASHPKSPFARRVRALLGSSKPSEH